MIAAALVPFGNSGLSPKACEGGIKHERLETARPNR